MGPEGGLTCGPAAALGTSVPLRGKADTWACFAGHRSGSHANVDAAIVDTGKTQPMSSFLDAKTTSKLPRRQSYLPKGPPLAERSTLPVTPSTMSRGDCPSRSSQKDLDLRLSLLLQWALPLHSVFVLHFLSSFYSSSLLHLFCQLCWCKI